MCVRDGNVCHKERERDVSEIEKERNLSGDRERKMRRD